MSLTTRQPTGLPSWPILLIAGVEKAGKSWACAEASSSDLIDRTLWIGVGEDDPDEYGAIPGARFEIVEHDGTYRAILGAIEAARAEPIPNSKPHLIVLDSATRLWDLLCDSAQAEANRRAARKAQQQNRRAPDADVPISMDLWNVAKSRWGHILDALRDHQGPVILTARLDEVTVVNDKGDPTKDRTWKVKAEKGLPYDVGAIVQLRARGDAYLTGVRSTRIDSAAMVPLDAFSVEQLWRDLGLADEVGERTHGAARSDAPQMPDEDYATFCDAIDDTDDTDFLRRMWAEAGARGDDATRERVTARAAALKQVEAA